MTCPTSELDKASIITRAEQIFRQVVGVHHDRIREVTPYGLCPYWAWAVVTAARERGKRLVMQAGSASWRMVPPHLDDGVSATHFSYMFEPDNPTNRLALAAGVMPEMHVWAGDPVCQELVDLSTRDVRSQAERLLGATWQEADLPRFIWSRHGELPAGTIYRPSMDATVIAARMLMSQGLDPRGGLIGGTR